MTSWQRRSISGLARCTEAKSRSSPVPEAIDDAAPPTEPISIAGPPSTISGVPAGNAFFSTCPRGYCRAAGEHDRLVITAVHHPAPRARFFLRRYGSSRAGWDGRTRC